MENGGSGPVFGVANRGDVSGHFTLNIYWENDGTAADPFDSYDRHYTNGVAFTLDHQPMWGKRLAPYMPFASLFEKHHGEPVTGVGYVLGQQIYTPRAINLAAPNPADQPWAGYLYGGVYWERQAAFHGRNDAAVLDHFELNLGVVGPSSLAEEVQSEVHRIFNEQDPQGWANQLDDEFAYQFYARRKWRFDLDTAGLPLIDGLEAQAIPQAGIALGNVHRYAEAAVTLRIGHNLPGDFGPGRINDLSSINLHEEDSTDRWSCYAWARVGGRAVEHNTFLDGSNTQNPSPSIDKEALVGELQFGLALAYHDGPTTLAFTWGVTYLTDEIDAPTGSNADDGTDSYGTMNLSIVHRF